MISHTIGHIHVATFFMLTLSPEIHRYGTKYATGNTHVYCDSGGAHTTHVTSGLNHRNRFKKRCRSMRILPLYVHICLGYVCICDVSDRLRYHTNSSYYYLATFQSIPDLHQAILFFNASTSTCRTYDISGFRVNMDKL